MTNQEKTIYNFCGKHADWWPSISQIKEMQVLLQKDWKGLTDEEISEMHNEIKVRLMGTYKTEDIYRVIESKLKEKNA